MRLDFCKTHPKAFGTTRHVIADSALAGNQLFGAVYGWKNKCNIKHEVVGETWQHTGDFPVSVSVIKFER